MVDLQTVLRPTGDYCIRELDDEMIFLSLEGDRLHALDDVGAFIWNAVDGDRSLADIRDLLCAEYEVAPETAAADLTAFAAELVALGLVDSADGDA